MKQAIAFVLAAAIGSGIVLAVITLAGQPLTYDKMPGLYSVKGLDFRMPNSTDFRSPKT